MAQRPTLTTERLLLRPFELSDAADVRRLAGERDIATTTLRVPHPYPEGAAEEWIGTHQHDFDEGRGVEFAITDRESGELIGSIGLRITRDHAHAELGYWIGKPSWGRGYATEAGRAVLDYGFRELSLRRIHAHHMAHNPPSGQVLKKLGMRHESTLREHVFKWGDFHDCIMYGLLRSEWEAANSGEGDADSTHSPRAISRLETPRLALRRFTPADEPALAEICNDFDIASTTDGIPHPYTLADAAQFIRESTATNLAGESSIFAVCLRDSGELIGDVGLYEIDADNRKADLGVVVAKKHWRRGYGTECSRAIIKHGFTDLDLHRVESGCLPRNVASLKMIERCGFTREGVRRQSANQFGVFEDEVVFGMLKSEWSAAEAAMISPPATTQGERAT